MKLLLDTHLLLWAVGRPEAARELIEAEENELLFSAASLWEVEMLLPWNVKPLLKAQA